MSSGYTSFSYALSVASTASSASSTTISLKALPELLGKSVAGFIRHADSLAAGPATNFTVSVRKHIFSSFVHCSGPNNRKIMR
eukprot:COSAG03_NODE_2451_length_2748_cov_2.147225_3_plen_83_part_00